MGALIGLLLMAPLLALFYLGSQAAGLPLVPLDFFDQLVPLIPGELITFVIDIMVNAIIGLGYGQDVDTIAKTIEQAMGFAFVLGLGVVTGALFFAFVPASKRPSYITGTIVGVALGAIFAAISLSNNFYDTSATLAALWVIALFTAWGVALSWIYTDLADLPTPAEQPDATDMPEANVRQINRREFLVRVGGATATLTVVGAGLGLALREEDGAPTVAQADQAAAPNATAEAAAEVDPNALPNANAAVQPAPGMRPEYTPVEDHYRIDIASRPIEIDLATWTLPFTGMIAQDRAFTMDELREMNSLDQYITMQCISNRLGGNLISTTKWTGVPVRDVLEMLEIEEGGAWMLIDGGDNFFEYVSIEQCMNDERIMFTYDFDGEPLPERNGFPLRIYIPERYGMKQPKWITGIEIVEEDERGYWVRRSWSADAIMQTTSVVDTVANNDMYRGEDGTVYVPVGGYAISSTRGISKVEVRIDDGEWTETQLRDPISDKTWVFWRYDYPFQEGEHTFEVRCYEADGTLQPTDEQGVRPDGATGIHSASANLMANEGMMPDEETAS